MFTDYLSTLKINKLSQSQYDRELSAGKINDNELYLIPDEQITLSDLGVTATASELNKMDGVTATTTELNYCDGVTSNIQTQLNGKQASITGGASTITSSNLTTNRALVSNGSGKVAVSDVTSTELGYLDGVTSNVQTQLNGKVPTSRTVNGKALTGNISLSASDVGASATGHTHSFSDITSGILPVSCGGTGNTSGYVRAGQKSGTTIGSYATAEGYNTTASMEYSHAEGYESTASGGASHAEGNLTTASEYAAHAEGMFTTASGSYSHAEGYETNAEGTMSHAEGYGTTALAYQHAQGHNNNTNTATEGNSYGTSSGTAFVIGNGTQWSRANAFRVTYEGAVYAQSAYNAIGADYAEFFEWLDGNAEMEDRRGYFVTLDGDKIKIAKKGDYILGVISCNPSVIGNADEEWVGRYITDEFGLFVTEEFEYEEKTNEIVIDEKTNEPNVVEKTTVKIGTKYKENPSYDSTRAYIQRQDRPEWDAVGMLGVLHIRDDGTCQVNGYCEVSDSGTATASNTGYRVIKRVNENVVKIIFR